MRTLIILALLTLTTACTVVVKDPRCSWNQYCPYTDAPSAIRTEVIREPYTGYKGEPRTVRKDPAVR